MEFILYGAPKYDRFNTSDADNTFVNISFIVKYDNILYRLNESHNSGYVQRLINAWAALGNKPIAHYVLSKVGNQNYDFKEYASAEDSKIIASGSSIQELAQQVNILTLLGQINDA